MTLKRIKKAMTILFTMHQVLMNWLWSTVRGTSASFSRIVTKTTTWYVKHGMVPSSLSSSIWLNLTLLGSEWRWLWGRLKIRYSSSVKVQILSLRNVSDLDRHTWRVHRASWIIMLDKAFVLYWSLRKRSQRRNTRRGKKSTILPLHR